MKHQDNAISRRMYLNTKTFPMRYVLAGGRIALAGGSELAAAGGSTLTTSNDDIQPMQQQQPLPPPSPQQQPQQTQPPTPPWPQQPEQQFLQQAPWPAGPGVREPLLPGSDEAASSDVGEREPGETACTFWGRTTPGGWHKTPRAVITFKVGAHSRRVHIQGGCTQEKGAA